MLSESCLHKKKTNKYKYEKTLRYKNQMSLDEESICCTFIERLKRDDKENLILNKLLV